MTFVDVIVGVSVMLLVFLAIFGAFKLAIELVYSTKAKAGGMSLVSQQLEFIRGLSYDAVGTVGGIPSGTIPQVATTSLNNINYTVRTLVLYTDAPEDGLGSSDSTLITADYKTVKVEVSWMIKNTARSTYAVARVSPVGVETLTSGGMLRINVYDALSVALAGAAVRVQNSSTTPAIDVSVTSDSAGTVLIPGTPPASNYRITVTKSGYSTAQTYSVTTQNPNPNPGHLAVANRQTTTGSFFIDRTGTLRFTTYSPIATGAYTDTFDNQEQLAATTSTTVSGGILSLLDTGSGYASSGDALSTTVQPAALVGWDTLTWTSTTPAGTTAAVQLYYMSGATPTLVPDGVLAGNSAGLTASPVALTGVSTTTYPGLRVKALLSTTDASTTPAIAEWSVGYRAGPTLLPGVGFSIRGNKTVGSTAGGTPIYKYTSSFTTDHYSEWVLSPLEWDAYTLSLSGSTYDIAAQCPYPLSLQPAEDRSVSVQLVPHSATTLRVAVTAAGNPLTSATATITGPEDGTASTQVCGQAFFSGLSNGTYTLTVTAPGYQPSMQDISVSGQTVVPVALVP